MYKYEVTGRWMNIHSEITVALTEQQAAQFGENIDPRGKSRYRVKQPIQIPKGQIFGCDIQLSQVNCKQLRGDYFDQIVPQAQRQEPPVDNNLILDSVGQQHTDEDEDEKTDNLADIDLDDLESLHWKQVKALVEAAGGEWVNKQEGIEFLRLNAETKPDGD